MSRTGQVYLMIGLAGLAMLGLIGLQVYWIQGALATNEESFNSHVAEALTAVNQEIEKKETLYRSQGPSASDSPSTDSAAIQERMENSLEKLKAEEDINKDSLKQLLKPLKKLIDSTEGANKLADSNVNTLTIEGSDSLNIELPALKDTIIDAFSKGVLKFVEGVSVFRKLAKDLKQAGKDQTPELKVDRLDSLIARHLENHGIEASYHMGVLKRPGGQHFLYTSPSATDSLLLNSAHGTALFGSNIFTKTYELKVYFPKKQWALLERIKWMMGSSVLFLGLLIGSFAWISKHFFRQKQLSEIKTDFINNMTHELKTPISTISLATEALQDQQLSADYEQRQRFTQMIGDENKRLSYQVERVLQMAKLEKGTFELKEEQLDLLPLLQKVADNFQFRITEQDGSFSYETQISKAPIMGDEVHLTNVFQNLLDNAIKYAEGPPDITLRVGRYLRYLRIEVADKGIGMSANEQQYIFDKFYRVSNGNVHNVQGFGLGLSYVATIIKAHSGSIRVSSSKGRGTTFYLYLPLAAQELGVH